MKPIETCTIGIVGLGLMGGAIAQALRAEHIIGEQGRILACDIDEAVLRAAQAARDIDAGFTSPETMLGQCDLVFLCLSPSKLLGFMEQWMPVFSPGTLITDIAGVKKHIVAVMERTLRDDLDFIPGHPMAGSEKGGYFHAKHCTFHGKNYILTPLTKNTPEHLDFLKALIRRMGFSRITETSAQDHDRKIAFTSQLSHVIAAALIDCESDIEITRFGGGSFEDLTRIAMLNAPMWTELFLENKDELVQRIRQFQQSLDKLTILITTQQRERLEENLLLVRKRRGSMV